MFKRLFIYVANLNDRSQLGNRDSEIAIIVEDKETIDTFMGGKEVRENREFIIYLFIQII